MNSFVVRTYVNELIVSIENVRPGFVHIFIHRMNYQSEQPSFYLEHASRGIKANFEDILAEVKRMILYHFIWTHESEVEFKEWLENQLNSKHIY